MCELLLLSVSTSSYSTVINVYNASQKHSCSNTQSTARDTPAQ